MVRGVVQRVSHPTLALLMVGFCTASSTLGAAKSANQRTFDTAQEATNALGKAYQKEIAKPWRRYWEIRPWRRKGRPDSCACGSRQEGNRPAENGVVAFYHGYCYKILTVGAHPPERQAIML